MFRQFLVEEGVVGVDQIQHAAVLAHDPGKSQFGFLTHRAAQIAVEFDLWLAIAASALSEHRLQFRLLLRSFLFVRNGIEFLEPLATALEVALLAAVAREHHTGVDVDAFHVAGLEPLPDEVLDQRIGAFVRQHSFHLRAEISAQLAPIG